MEKKKFIALDFGGVLGYQDYSNVTDYEHHLINAYLNRNYLHNYASLLGISEQEILNEAECIMKEIYPKIHRVPAESYVALQLILDMGLIPSIWTNNISQFDYVLDRLGMYKYIDEKYICNSIFMEGDKPDLIFYKNSLQRIQAEPSEVLFFDDSVKNVNGAVKAGIDSVCYNLNSTQGKNLAQTIKTLTMRGGK